MHRKPAPTREAGKDIHLNLLPRTQTIGPKVQAVTGQAATVLFGGGALGGVRAGNRGALSHDQGCLCRHSSDHSPSLVPGKGLDAKKWVAPCSLTHDLSSWLPRVWHGKLPTGPGPLRDRRGWC